MREKILAYLSHQTVALHGLVKKSTQPWPIAVKDLAVYPPGSLGKALHQFYTHHGFTPIPKMEYHDAEHILLELGSDVKSEIQLQFFAVGNGKKTFFALIACIASICIMPEVIGTCIQAYKKGKTYQPIWHVDYRNELSTPLVDVRKKVLVPITHSKNK